jgi:hypothetical protein
VQVSAIPFSWLCVCVGWLIEWKFISINSDDSSVPSIVVVIIIFENLKFVDFSAILAEPNDLFLIINYLYNKNTILMMFASKGS